MSPVPDKHGKKCLLKTLLVEGRSSNDTRDTQHVKEFKYPSARLIMVDRKVHAHNLVSSLDNN